MPAVTDDLVLDRVEHILASGVGSLDFAVAGENEYYSWWGTEDADWTVENVGRVENAEEDRFVLYPESEFFSCEIAAEGEEGNPGPVRCR